MRSTKEVSEGQFMTQAEEPAAEASHCHFSVKFYVVPNILHVCFELLQSGQLLCKELSFFSFQIT